MDINEEYKSFLTETIKKQMLILGPQIALLKARSVTELTVSDDGTVTNLQGDPDAVIKKLVDKYVELSGLIVQNAMGSLLTKYPNLKKNLTNS